jgi:hypothetical protein
VHPGDAYYRVCTFGMYQFFFLDDEVHVMGCNFSLVVVTFDQFPNLTLSITA